jgi:hypothetical protein
MARSAVSVPGSEAVEGRPTVDASRRGRFVAVALASGDTTTKARAALAIRMTRFIVDSFQCGQAGSLV